MNHGSGHRGGTYGTLSDSLKKRTSQFLLQSPRRNWVGVESMSVRKNCQSFVRTSGIRSLLVETLSKSTTTGISSTTRHLKKVKCFEPRTEKY